MGNRGPQSFKKRQKEQQRKEKQQEKLAKRLQRKQEGSVPVDDEPDMDQPHLDRLPEAESTQL
jgi:hypothetical protein